MKKTFAIAALVFSTGAFAAQTNTGCQGNCPGDSITNQGGVGYGGNGGNATAGAVGIAIAGGGTGGSGGAGGAGGAGGSVVGSGNSSATGGAVVGSGNSTQGQQQGQVANGGNANQGQSQSSNSGVKGSGNSANTVSGNGGNAAGNTTKTEVTVTGGDTTYQAARIPVATAYAPNIVATALCKFGVSGGGQGMTFGFSVGVSITDENCMLLEQVRTVSVILGQKEVAQEMMMAVPAYAEAVARMKGVKATAGTDVKPVSVQAKAEYTDPIIRSRLGLPPLK